MSTRGLYGYIEQGKYTGQYIPCDAYPTGEGYAFYSVCKSKKFDQFKITDDYISFIENSLLCEWAYFYDKEKEIFEVWVGYQNTPQDDNIFGQTRDNDGFYPCKCVIRSKINNYPDDWHFIIESDDSGNGELVLSRQMKIDEALSK